MGRIFTLALAGKALVAALFLGLALGGHAHAQKFADAKMAKAVPVEMDYLLYLPKDYDGKAGEKFPLVVYLHGGGASDLGGVRRNFLPSRVDRGEEFPFIMLAPRNPRKREFFPQEWVQTLVEEIAATHRVDRDRIYLIGYSRGAFAAFQIVQNYPGTYAALVAVSGGGIPQYLDRVRPDMPVWVFHGTDDSTIKLIESVAMVQRLKDLGGGREIRFTVYEDAGHTETERLAFSEPKLFDWLLKQTRAKPEDLAPVAKLPLEEEKKTAVLR